MLENFFGDKEFIENKYHKSSEPFDPFQRMAYHGWECDNGTGLGDDEILRGLDDLSNKTNGLPHPVAKAKAIEFLLKNMRIDVNKHDWFPAFYSLNRLANKTTQNKWYNEVFGNIIPEIGTNMNEFNASGALAIWPDFDHVVPDWNSIMELGFSGLRTRAAKYKKRHEENGTLTDEMSAHFDGIDITYKAIIDILDRLYQFALTQKHGKAEKMAECFKSIRDGAPQNIYEAMQVIYIYFIVSECVDSYQVRSLGNGLDNTLYEFYKQDLENGKFTRDEIKEFLAYFMFQWQSIGNYWGQPFYMGGTNADGTTKYNGLSYDILEVYDELGIYNPKIQIKINDNTPEIIINKVLDMVRRGHNSFVFCCEPGMIKAVMGYGATYNEAREMDIRGCYETGVKANEVSTVTGYINAAKAIEFVFSNGYDKESNKQIGLITGDIESFRTFNDFYFATLKQWENIIETSIQMSDEFEKYMSYINPSLMYSATIEGSLEKGLDAYQNGVKFNNSAVLNCGFASLVDSVMAVKYLVYDTHTTTLSALKEALEANWVGYDDLRAKALNCPKKYGNGENETDMYAERMAQFFATKVNNRPNARGGVYKAIMHSARQYVLQGEKTLALPDGRKSYEELSKNASPVAGMDKEGVTALVSSVSKLKPYTYSESFCLDVVLHPSAVEGDDGLEVMKSLLRYYMNNDGMSMQFNVFNIDTLRDAQANPEKYKNLQVRVCGWNVLWNNMNKSEQDAYITRAENLYDG